MSNGGTTIETTGTVLLIPRDTQTGKTTGLLLLLERKDTPGHYTIVCFGPKRHFRRSGLCRCVEAVLALMTEEARANTTLDPWGGKPR